MKYILFLLFSATCLAQNIKVTVYRLVEEHDDGPCSVKIYVENPHEFHQTYVTAESYDLIFAQSLLKLKKTATRWKKQNHFCSPRMRGGYMIPNMFVIESAFRKDTLFTYYNNELIIFPERDVAYFDGKGALKSTFPENIKEFFDHDFRTQIRSLSYLEENDSITTDKILYNEKPAFEIFNKDFDKHPGNFRKVRETPLDNDTAKTYILNNDTIDYYSKKVKITITSPNSGFKVDRLKVGDTEEKLIAQYPASARVQKFYSIRYEDILRKYFYWVILSDNEGIITYFIKDHLIEKIEIDL